MGTPGMNLGGDKALKEKDYRCWSESCVCVGAHMCMEPETSKGAGGFSHLVAQEWRQTAQGGRGSGGF